MARRALLARLLLVVALAGVPAPAPAVTPEEFGVRSGADIVALCSTPASDPLYTAAVHMCHGFGAGTYRTIMAMSGGGRLQPVICPPDPSPSRNEVVQRFVQWAKANERHLAEPAVDVLARFLITQFPCGPR
jgi:hypothetical protein